MDQEKAVTATFSDIVAPSGTILINGGADRTNNPNVTLTLSAGDPGGVTEMKFSHDNNTWLNGESYAPSKNWTLLSGDGTKSVYVQTT